MDITWGQLLLFACALIIPYLINAYFDLQLLRVFNISILRMSAQLFLVGSYLKFLFVLNNAYINIAWLLMMLLVGCSAIVSNTKYTRKKIFWPVLISLCVALFPILSLLLIGILKVEPFYNAQYLIPLAGMLLGNCLSGNIVALQHLFNSFKDKKDQYESALALGANSVQASFAFVQDALRQSLAPILASMATTGLVTLPGMMTGQILSGSDPMLAIKYQLLIMLAIFVMLSLSVALCLSLTVRYSIYQRN
ncbi:hypothetical protein PCNPT3_06080 [Psychromonas sp. CNPT3]|uniref:ABC transporter permease n=1 Tax=Psychromonas sp. CNPT3 TaxID=314282 RepID=UPI00006E83EC|nr:ABC transporter permease [Psychromonas sp. CNPT3]AGH81158.1 hypothetical protein PCNPT3_06080 [Psychromonas sp. CNPT3]